MAGYTVGKKSGHAAALSDIHKVQTADPQTRETAISEAKTEAMTEAKTELETTMETPVPAEAASAELARFALRAEESTLTLTDTQRRTLQGELLETTESHLNIRRHPDNQVLDVPVAMLSQEDQAFAAYLFNQGIKVIKAEPKLDSEIIWQKLFEDI
ncbi:MAG: hypothetical protein EA353_01910 [Puniceicoccaceae bacterium]|nr:MAG: hypothetical protein EA353_01910 [Puniceicoccaceae bacterium]